MSSDEENWPVLVCPDAGSGLDDDFGGTENEGRPSTTGADAAGCCGSSASASGGGVSGGAASDPIVLSGADTEGVEPQGDTCAGDKYLAGCANKRRRGSSCCSSTFDAVSGGSRFVACPLCSRSFHTAAIEAHASECQGDVPLPAPKQRRKTAERGRKKSAGPQLDGPEALAARIAAGPRPGAVAFGPIDSPVRPTPPTEPSTLGAHAAAQQEQLSGGETEEPPPSPSLSPDPPPVDTMAAQLPPQRQSLWALACSSSPYLASSPRPPVGLALGSNTVPSLEAVPHKELPGLYLHLSLQRRRVNRH